jgi:DNA-binding CsgD family transcriptional regulator
MRVPLRQIELHAFAHAQPGHSLAVIDLKGKPPTRATMVGIVNLLRRDSTMLVVNAYRPTVTPPPSTVSWTPREALVVDGILSGLSNSAIAARIGTSKQMIKKMCFHICRKLKVKTRVELILLTNSREHFFLFNVADDGSLVVADPLH